jgi:hypothetical protein
MEERYRNDYEGEFVIVGVKMVNGKKQQEREFVENPIQIKSNFHVTFNDAHLHELIDKKLTEDIIVYTSTTQCLKRPGEFFIVPYGYKSTEEAVAAYLAAFDGHREVFLVGYDEFTTDGLTRRTKMVETVGQVIKTYSATKFYHVTPEDNVPKEWMPYRNLEAMTVREFISYCDIS